jgi:dTDP-4-dehydrorhamnose reductase
MTSETNVRAVILGGTGLLGRHLVATLPEQGFTLAAVTGGRADLDIADGDRVAALLAQHRPALVFNAAAYTDVDGAEDDPQRSERANALGPEVLARACLLQGCRLIHFSTDFVFDGESEQPYDESSPTSPQAVYARSKVDGEERALRADPRTQVLRVGCLYGRGGRNFPSQLLGRLREGVAIRADDERRVSPTWVGEVAALTGRLARTEGRGIFHVTARGETTWAVFARTMAAWTGLPSTVEAVRGTSLPLKAPRPRRSILVSRRLPEHGVAPMPPWKMQLHAYLGSEGVPVRVPDPLGDPTV